MVKYKISYDNFGFNKRRRIFFEYFIYIEPDVFISKRFIGSGVYGLEMAYNNEKI